MAGNEPLWQQRAIFQVVHSARALLGGVLVGLIVIGTSQAWLSDTHPSWTDMHSWVVALLWGGAAAVVTAFLIAPYIQRNSARTAFFDLEAELNEARRAANDRRAEIEAVMAEMWDSKYAPLVDARVGQAAKDRLPPQTAPTTQPSPPPDPAGQAGDRKRALQVRDELTTLILLLRHRLQGFPPLAAGIGAASTYRVQATRDIQAAASIIGTHFGNAEAVEFMRPLRADLNLVTQSAQEKQAATARALATAGRHLENLRDSL